MEQSNLTSRQLYQAFKANPTRKRFGFGRKPALINIDLQKPTPASASSPPPTRPTPASLSM